MDTIRFISAAIADGKEKDPGLLPPLVLAYIGDTVYDLYARTRLIETREMTPKNMHLTAAKFVCAQGQAEAMQRITPLLSEEEASIFRRGRNAHSGTVPKNASGANYHAATGLEALIGYLFLSGRDERVAELMKIALEGADT